LSGIFYICFVIPILFNVYLYLSFVFHAMFIVICFSCNVHEYLMLFLFVTHFSCNVYLALLLMQCVFGVHFSCNCYLKRIFYAICICQIYPMQCFFCHVYFMSCLFATHCHTYFKHFLSWILFHFFYSSCNVYLSRYFMDCLYIMQCLFTIHIARSCYLYAYSMQLLFVTCIHWWYIIYKKHCFFSVIVRSDVQIQ
jgi:hypothetical protein